VHKSCSSENSWGKTASFTLKASIGIAKVLDRQLVESSHCRLASAAALGHKYPLVSSNEHLEEIIGVEHLHLQLLGAVATQLLTHLC